MALSAPTGDFCTLSKALEYFVHASTRWPLLKSEFASFLRAPAAIRSSTGVSRAASGAASCSASEACSFCSWAFEGVSRSASAASASASRVRPSALSAWARRYRALAEPEDRASAAATHSVAASADVGTLCNTARAWLYTAHASSRLPLPKSWFALSLSSVADASALAVAACAPFDAPPEPAAEAFVSSDASAVGTMGFSVCDDGTTGKAADTEAAVAAMAAAESRAWRNDTSSTTATTGSATRADPLATGASSGSCLASLGDRVIRAVSLRRIEWMTRRSASPSALVSSMLSATVPAAAPCPSATPASAAAAPTSESSRLGAPIRTVTVAPVAGFSDPLPEVITRFSTDLLHLCLDCCARRHPKRGVTSGTVACVRRKQEARALTDGHGPERKRQSAQPKPLPCEVQRHLSVDVTGDLAAFVPYGEADSDVVRPRRARCRTTGLRQHLFSDPLQHQGACRQGQPATWGRHRWAEIAAVCPGLPAKLTQLALGGGRVLLQLTAAVLLALRLRNRSVCPLTHRVELAEQRSLLLERGVELRVCGVEERARPLHEDRREQHRRRAARARRDCGGARRRRHAEREARGTRESAERGFYTVRFITISAIQHVYAANSWHPCSPPEGSRASMKALLSGYLPYRVIVTSYASLAACSCSRAACAVPACNLQVCK
eukprot:scaffold303174_cov30-Tisochrysis_lutea.AAC.2